MSACFSWIPGKEFHAEGVADDNTCGFHAFKRRLDALTYASGSGCVIGQVALWGTVIEHELGYRGEYAAVHSLDHILGSSWFKKNAKLKALRETYQL